MKSRTSIAFCQRPVRNPAHGVAGAFDRLWGVMVAAMEVLAWHAGASSIPRHQRRGVAASPITRARYATPLSTRSTREAHDVGVPPAYRRRTPDRFRQRRAAKRCLVLTVRAAARAIHHARRNSWSKHLCGDTDARCLHVRVP